jgi:hypothetical protein
MFGYDYEIIYKKGKENVVVDALSRKYEEDRSLFLLSCIVVDWLKVVCREWFQEPKLSHLIQYLQQYPHASLGYPLHNVELHYTGHVYLSK